MQKTSKIVRVSQSFILPASPKTSVYMVYMIYTVYTIEIRVEYYVK